MHLENGCRFGEPMLIDHAINETKPLVYVEFEAKWLFAVSITISIS